MPSKLQVRVGRVLFQRLGTLKPHRQGRWKRAPGREGLWAFPWPYFSMFFAGHQYEAICPRRFRVQGADSEGLTADYTHWRTEIAPRVLPIRRFWYEGDVFTHLARHGDDLGLHDWQCVSASEFAARAQRYWSRASRYTENREPRTPNVFDAEALEVFVPTRGGCFEPAKAPSRGSNPAVPSDRRGFGLRFLQPRTEKQHAETDDDHDVGHIEDPRA
jgi:hypothetical protein